MNIACIGTGFVGVVTAAVLAKLGNDVIGLDIELKHKPSVVADNTRMPFYDRSFDVIVYDPPHIPNQGKDKSKDFNTRFGLGNRASKEFGYSFSHTYPPFVKEAFRVRKAWGGGMRQVGVIAAAGLFAVRNNIPRLKDDHEKAKMLANGLSKISRVEIHPEFVETNILMFTPKDISIEDFQLQCKNAGLLLGTGKVGEIRAVTHLDVSFEQINEAVKIVASVLDK